jgi:succinate dehydrogenase flavin-adding protein (antitoxin of CptAB toxin-antitoxin module)
VEAEYRKEMNYHKIGDYREKRFRKYYDHTIQTFDKDKASDRSGPYKIGMYDTLIQKTDEELTSWVNKNTSYKRNIYRYDVDIALEYILMCSKNSMNQARETLIRKYACQEGVSVERAKIQLQNTAPRKGLEKFFDYVSVNQTIEGKKINKCDRKKASALFCLVVELGLCECIDDSYDRGKARKFRVSDAVRQVRESWDTKKNLNGDNIGGAINTMRLYSDISADKKVS